MKYCHSGVGAAAVSSLRLKIWSAVGWNAPPDWPTVNDPQGVGLTLVLIGKETPFLLWNAVALLARPELALQLRGWLASASTLGYGDAATWWRVLWPLLLP